jgi:hypothetical protein
MVALVIGVLLVSLLALLFRMACDCSPDSRMVFLEILLETVREAVPDRLKHERIFAGRAHHRHRFGV